MEGLTLTIYCDRNCHEIDINILKEVNMISSYTIIIKVVLRWCGCAKWLHHIAKKKKKIRFLDFKNIYNFSSPIIYMF